MHSVCIHSIASTIISFSSFCCCCCCNNNFYHCLHSFFFCFFKFACVYCCCCFKHLNRAFVLRFFLASFRFKRVCVLTIYALMPPPNASNIDRFCCTKEREIENVSVGGMGRSQLHSSVFFSYVLQFCV